MWRKCCLKSAIQAFQQRDGKGSKPAESDYVWCFVRDVGNMTFSGARCGLLRRAGLIYSQFYGMNKLQFDAKKHFPWEDAEDTLSMMAMDEIYREAMRATMGTRPISMPMCRQSYNHSGRRFMLAVRGNDDKSWGAREEHRLSLALLMEIISELQSRGNPELRRRKTRKQFYVFETKVVNRFTELVTLPIARWFQEVLGMAPEGRLGQDRQKLAILLSFLLKGSYSSTLLRRYPFLYLKKLKGDESKKEIGLGLKEVITRFGFGWMPDDIFDWEMNNFSPGIADRFPFPVQRLKNLYKKRGKERKEMIDILQEMDQITGRINTLTESEDDRTNYRFLICWLAIRIIKQYYRDVWNALYRSPHEFKGKEIERRRQSDEQGQIGEARGERLRSHGFNKRRQIKHRGSKWVQKSWDKIPLLTYESVKRELAEDPVPCGRGRSYVTKREIFDLLFGLDGDDDDNDCRGQGWQNKKYLHALKHITVHLDEVTLRKVLRRMWKLFDNYCLCIPLVSKDRWLAKNTWIGFDEHGERMDYPNCGGRFYKGRWRSHSSWMEEISIDEEYCWNLELADILSEEGLRNGRTYVKEATRQ
jgi:hypothetical protein